MDTTTSGAQEPAANEAQRAVVEQIRRMASAALLSTAGTGSLQRALALLQEATDLLDATRRSSRYEGVAGLLPGITPENDAIWETHAAFGGANALAPPVVAVERPGHVEGTLTFSPSYEGGPGTVYGGFIAAVFDGMLGRAVISSGRLGVTRSLSVRYLRPTPLSTPLRIESEVTGATGNDVEVKGRLWAADRLTSEAEAIFRCVEGGRYQMAAPEVAGPPPRPA
jgi:acyl-coenzyme A thioesterase PaaI-like protein